MSKPEKKDKGLARRTRQGISWTAAGAVASNLVRLATYMLLGRLLTRIEFGTMAAVMTVIMFGNMLKDFGVGVALIQRKDVEREHIEAAFTFSVVLGVVVAAGLFVSADLFAAFYRIESSVNIIRVLSLLFLLRGVSLVPSFLCRRDMSFRALTIVDIAGYVSGAVVSISLAFAGAGAWSLALGYVVETVINTVALIYLAPPPSWRLRLRWRHLKELFGVGLGLSASNLFNYFALNGDYMVIGRYLGTAALGPYQRAYELMRFPASVFTTVAGSVLFSAFTKVQDDPERLGRAFRRTLFACAVVLLPATAGMIVLAPEVVRILLGPGWGEVEWPLRIMATSMLFRTTYKLASLVGKSTGDAMGLLIWQVVYAVCVAGGALFSVRWGIMGVAATTAISVFLQFLAMARLGMRASTLTAREVAAAHIEPVLYALIVGGAAWATAFGLRAAGAAFPVVAAATTIVGVVAFLALLRLGIRRTSGDWPWLRETILGFLGRKKKKPKAPAGAVAFDDPEPRR